jgi:Holliday junction DNA helicase RuvB
MSNSIRPSSFDSIIGQDDVLTRLRVSVAGCKNSGSVMPHVLIDGPPGLGKTTIAGAIANEMGVNLYTANAASIRSIKNIMPYIMGLSPRSVLFIDEIHRLPKIVEEFLYPVMEDFGISVVSKDDEDKEVVDQIDIPLFTLIGATTSGGCLSQPFYDRFTIKEHLSFYNEKDLAKVARLNCDKMGIVISDADLLEIANRSKGTPRILNARLLWYKNFISCYPDTNKTIDDIFAIQGIDSNGFDSYDRLYLDILKKSTGNPLGLKSISSMTGIAIETIENSIEPYMVRKGLVIRTQKGRILSNTK